jgi:hypothetical protein
MRSWSLLDCVRLPDVRNCWIDGTPVDVLPIYIQDVFVMKAVEEIINAIIMRVVQSPQTYLYMCNAENVAAYHSDRWVCLAVVTIT